MSLYIEKIKMIPSALQEIIETNQSVILKCGVVVPNNIQKHKTLKLNLRPSCFKLSIPNLQRWYGLSDASVLYGTKRNTSNASTTFNCILNFPVNKVVRGIHPSTLATFHTKAQTLPTPHSDTNTYTWQEQLESWISLYDAEISSYYEAKQCYPVSDEILTCENSNTSPMIMIEYKRKYQELSGDIHVEYLYYLTLEDSYDESFMKSAMLEYHELFNSGSDAIQVSSVFKSTRISCD